MSATQLMQQLQQQAGQCSPRRCTVQNNERSRVQKLFGFSIWYTEQKCCGALTGECWSFCGGHGHLTIGLSQRINVSVVSSEHLPVEMSPEQANSKRHTAQFPRFNYPVRLPPASPRTLPFCPTSCCPSCRCFFFADFSLFAGTLVMPLPARHASVLSTVGNRHFHC
ncbi:hypothetical protein niasHT_008823 [Heterodera trifolii]|uniref:SUN domain-containing protein n=1 Tax=Heterodera trifolii TaxID=157864 RepID=A0ABD2LUK6_9BILA